MDLVKAHRYVDEMFLHEGAASPGSMRTSNANLHVISQNVPRELWQH